MGATMIFLRVLPRDLDFVVQVSLKEKMFGGNKTRNLNLYALHDSCVPNYFRLLLAFSY